MSSKLEKENQKLKENNQKLKENNQILQDNCFRLVEELRNVKPKSIDKRIKELVESLEFKETVIDKLEEEIEQLEERLNQTKIETKTNSNNQTQFDTKELKIKELEKKLSRKGTGRKRNINVSDNEILELRQQGNTVKTISERTALSTATINRIISKNKK